MKKDAHFKSVVKNLLGTAQLSSDMIHIPEYDANDLCLVFCVTCLRREEQLLTAMMLNLSLWWSLRKYWRLVIVTFAEDKKVQQVMQKLMRLPIETGNVVLCSGGESGQQLAAGKIETHRPDWMPRESTDDSVAGNVCSPVQMPFMKYWHASIAKNSSHAAGIYSFPGEGSLLINLDCDQIVPIAYVKAALQTFYHNLQLPGFCLACLQHGALTGRLGYRQEDFTVIGGYDEDGPPSGGQDVDIRNRLVMLGEKVGSVPSTVEWLNSSEVCGFALPNDFKNTDRNHDRGESKIVNCNPQFFKGLDCSLKEVWQNMNTVWYDRFWKKQWKDKVMKRNTTVKSKKAALGAWWVVTSRHVVPHSTTQHFDDAQGRPAAGSADVDIVNEAPISPKVSSGPAQSVVGRDVGIPVELFIVGAEEIQWKIHTTVSSLGRSNEYVVVIFQICQRRLDVFAHHGMCVIGLQVV